MRTKLPAIVIALLLLPCAALAWTGDTWANLTRATIRSNADLMIDSTWVPKNTFTNWEYGTTYHTYTKDVVYTGVPYSQTYNIAGMVQENWTEFRKAVTNTSGGTVAYGNDCSGFTSICWKLPTREVTSTFESKLGGTAKWFSLGDIGTAATAPLEMGDALNSSSVGHVVLFLNYETTGVRTMEQTPNNAQRKVRSYSNVAEYRPIRRLQILEERGIAVSGNLAFGGVLSGSSAQRALTIKSTGLSAMTVSNVSLPAGFSGNWSGTIAPGGSQNVTITFSPTTVASYDGTLTVNSDAVAPTNTLSLSGTGVVQAPQITAQPQSQSIIAGQSATFAVTVSGLAPLGFQWRFNGANLAGATLSSYTRANAQYAHSGNYDIVVSNAYGVATSQLALLTVTLPPVLQTLWLDNFDANTAANWAMNRSSSDCRVTFNYDYAADGISSAPNSTNNTTRGVKFEANVSLATAAAINISPVGRSFSGDYRLRFDLWINQNGPFPAGGNGSTQHGTAGLGTAGNQVQWAGAGSTADGYWFAADGEGQASDTSTSAMNDFGAFSGTTCHAASSGVYAAGTASNSRGNGNSYYAGTFPGGQTAPASQQAAYSQQSGGLAAGTIGFAWRDVIINKTGNTVEWFIDGLRIATITGATFTSSNIFIGVWDSFSSLSDNTNLSFAVFDNVRVERFVTNVPPYLTAQPQGRTNLAGASVTLSVTATGTAPLCYRWQCDGNAYPPGTNTFLACQAGDYSVVVSNVAGMVTSAVATVVFTNPAPALPGHFDSISRLADGSVQLNMSGTAGTNYLLEWTSDWVGWSNLCTLSSADGSLSWVDPCATNSNRRFYRLRLEP